MSASRSIGKKRRSMGPESSEPATVVKRVILEENHDDDDDLDLDLDLQSDIKGIMNALHQIRNKAQKDGMMKNEKTISSVSSEIKSKLDELKSKLEKDRQGLAKALSKSSKECENIMKTEASKFQAIYDNFCKEKSAHLQALRDTISKYEEEKAMLCMKYEQQRKKEKNLISEYEKECATKIAQLEESLKKKKKDDKTFSILRKTLGSFLGNASDEDFPPDD